MNPGGTRRLLFCCLVIAIIWMIVLPWIARQDPVRQMIRRNEAAGIDPSAMFYTEWNHLTYEDGVLRKKSN